MRLFGDKVREESHKSNVVYRKDVNLGIEFSITCRGEYTHRFEITQRK